MENICENIHTIRTNNVITITFDAFVKRRSKRARFYLSLTVPLFSKPFIAFQLAQQNINPPQYDMVSGMLSVENT